MDVKTVTGDQLVDKLDSLAMKNSRPGSEGSYDYVEEQGDSMPTPIESTLSVQATEQWERQLMKDPKVPPRLAIHCHNRRKLNMTAESTCPLHSCETRQQCPHPTLGPDQGHPELQCQDRLGGESHHQPEIIWSMLALCCHQRLSGCHHEEVQFEGI